MAAWIIDFLIYFVITIAAVIIGIAIAGVGISDLADFDPGFFFGALAVVVILTLLASLVIFIVQIVLLVTRGQTIGKIIMKIRIVDAVTGQHPGWARPHPAQNYRELSHYKLPKHSAGRGRRILSR